MNQLDRERIKREYNLLCKLEEEEKEKEENKIIKIEFKKKDVQNIIDMLNRINPAYARTYNKLGITKELYNFLNKKYDRTD